MSLKDYSDLFDALSNERRRELFEFVLTFNFSSKNDLAIKFNMKRASLNHHLDSLAKAGLIHEVSLILDGRRHNFIIPAVNLFPDQLLQKRKDTQTLLEQLRIWTDRNLTLNNWKILRESLNNLDISEELVNSIEYRLFPLVGTRVSTETNYCFICKTNKAKVSCFACKNLMCKVHCYKIDRDELGTISLCPNCVNKFFG
ncbi:MAG: hypothetical protein ACFFB2_17580 [Promethearchaeota archaeon]